MSRRTPTTHELLPSETVLPDDALIHPGYVYICDNRFTRYDGWDSVDMLKWKAQANFKEIRRCDLFGHEGAHLGDEVIAKDSK